MTVGFVALLLSCSSSDQTGYDVKLSIVPPTETNGENPLPPIRVPVSLSPGNPSYNLGFADTSKWAPMLIREGALRADGRPASFNMSMEQLAFQADGTVGFSVRVFSRVGFVTGRARGYEPASQPSSCSFDLDPNNVTGATYADHINQCLSDWIMENGVPVDFDMEVTSSGAATAKSGFATKQTATSYSFTGEWTMQSHNPTDVGYSVEILDAVQEGEDIFGLLDCGGLNLTGTGNTDSMIDIFGGSGIWDACGEFLSLGVLGPTALTPGDYEITAQGGDNMGVTVTQNVPVRFFELSGTALGPQDPEDFIEALLTAAAGNCKSGAPITGRVGFAFVGWVHEGPVPRNGMIAIEASGNCGLATQ